MVADFNKIPALIRWNAMLSGGVICGKQFLESGTGPVHSFKSAMNTKRIVWITDGFIRKCVVVAQCTVQRMGQI